MEYSYTEPTIVTVIIIHIRLLMSLCPYLSHYVHIWYTRYGSHTYSYIILNFPSVYRNTTYITMNQWTDRKIQEYSGICMVSYWESTPSTPHHLIDKSARLKHVKMNYLNSTLGYVKINHLNLNLNYPYNLNYPDGWIRDNYFQNSPSQALL